MFWIRHKSTLNDRYMLDHLEGLCQNKLQLNLSSLQICYTNRNRFDCKSTHT